MSATVFGSGAVAADAAGAPLLVAAAGLSVPGAPASLQATVAETTEKRSRAARVYQST